MKDSLHWSHCSLPGREFLDGFAQGLYEPTALNVMPQCHMTRHSGHGRYHVGMLDGRVGASVDIALQRMSRETD